MPNLKDYLKKKLSKKELTFLRKSFDIVGDVAILEIPRELAKKQKIIARTVLDMHKNVNAVYVEQGGRTGKLRLQKMKWLAGEKRTETTCRENGISLRLDVAKAYFSPRISSERERIYKQVKKGETVLVMFSGVAPYVIEIAKHSKCKTVYGIEANRAAHKYAQFNAKLNKVEDKVKLHCGDVKIVIPKIRKKFDRIIMPLPKDAGRYLDLALRKTKPGGIVHFYDFLPEEEIPDAAKNKIMTAGQKLKKKIKILRIVKCGQLAPRAYRVCVDFRVT